MYKLYYHPGNASLAPHILLKEIDIPHELIYINRKLNEQKSEAYLKINPNGLIPTLVDGEVVIFESAAICLYLGDKHPTSNLVPPLGQTERAYLYKWLIYLSSTVQKEILAFHYPEQYIGSKSDLVSIDEVISLVKSTAEKRLVKMFNIINQAFISRQYMLGDSFSICDTYLLMLARWCRFLKIPPRSFPNLSRCLELVVSRPAVKEAFEVENIEKPYY